MQPPPPSPLDATGRAASSSREVPPQGASLSLVLDPLVSPSVSADGESVLGIPGQAHGCPGSDRLGRVAQVLYVDDDLRTVAGAAFVGCARPDVGRDHDL